MFRRRDAPLLLKILGALVLCLGIATVLTNAFETRLTRDALARQSRRLASSQLTLLTQAYLARERTLDTAVRNVGGLVVNRGLTSQSRRSELDAELGTSRRTGQLDVLEITDAEGGHPVPPAGIVTLRDAPDAAVASSAFDVNSYVLPATDGTYVQVVVAGVGPASDRWVIAGGYAFGDAFAYRLRAQVGDVGEVVLVAAGRVVGTTLTAKPFLPPGVRSEGAALPTSPTLVELSGVKRLVAYAPVSLDKDGTATGVLGVALADPAASLDRSLARGRVVTSLVLGALAMGLGWLLFRSLIRPLVDLSRTATRIADGDLDATFEVRGRDEIGVLGSSLARMTEVSRAQAHRIAETTRRIVTAQDEERHRIERNLHDGAQQRLLTASLAVGVAMTAEAAKTDADLATSLDDVARHLDLALAELRELARGIHPSILSEEGLGPALASLAEKSAVPARVVASFVDRLPAPIEATAYFVVSEAITNATRHARPSAVRISASMVDGHVVVEVADDGVGGADPAAGSGLVGLDDRVTALGGTLTVDSPAGSGTRIVARLPCE